MEHKLSLKEPNVIKGKVKQYDLCMHIHYSSHFWEKTLARYADLSKSAHHLLNNGEKQISINLSIDNGYLNSCYLLIEQYAQVRGKTDLFCMYKRQTNSGLKMVLSKNYTNGMAEYALERKKISLVQSSSKDWDLS